MVVGLCSRQHLRRLSLRFHAGCLKEKTSPLRLTRVCVRSVRWRSIEFFSGLSQSRAGVKGLPLGLAPEYNEAWMTLTTYPNYEKTLIVHELLCPAHPERKFCCTPSEQGLFTCIL